MCVDTHIQTHPNHVPSQHVCADALLDIVYKVVMSFMVMSAHDLLGESGSSKQRQYV